MLGLNVGTEDGVVDGTTVDLYQGLKQSVLMKETADGSTDGTALGIADGVTLGTDVG